MIAIRDINNQCYISTSKSIMNVFLFLRKTYSYILKCYMYQQNNNNWYLKNSQIGNIIRIKDLNLSVTRKVISNLYKSWIYKKNISKLIEN